MESKEDKCCCGEQCCCENEKQCCGGKCCKEDGQCCGGKCCKEDGQCCGGKCCKEENDKCCGGCHCGCDDEDDCCGGCGCGCDDDNEMGLTKNVNLQTIKEGEGYETPVDDSKLKLNYKIYSNDKLIEEKKDFECTLGGEVVLCKGFEYGLNQMKLHQIATFEIEPEDGFTEEENKKMGIENGSKIKFEVEILELFTKWTPYTIPNEEILTFVEQKKLQGNGLVKKQLYDRANKCYKRALDYLENDFKIPEDKKEEAKKIKVILYCNISAMYYNLKEYENAKTNAEESIKLDKDCWKAYFRKGKANLMLEAIESAKKDFEEVLRIDSENKEVKKELAIIKKKEQEQEKKLKKSYAKMFGCLGTLSEIDEEAKKRKEEEVKKQKEEWEQYKKSEKKEEKKEEENKKEETKEEEEESTGPKIEQLDE